MNFPMQPIKLDACQVHGAGSGAELFIVEGDSASNAVSRIRNPHFQAVLPMQGKPLNAIKATEKKVAGYALFAALSDALGAGWGAEFDAKKLRFDRVLLLMDPDADGIHCGALMLMYFYRWMRPLLDAGKIEMVRAPLAEICCDGRNQPIYAYSDDHYRGICDELSKRGVQNINARRYRGLAGINVETLAVTCVDPATRKTSPMGSADAEAAITFFGSGRGL